MILLKVNCFERRLLLDSHRTTIGHRVEASTSRLGLTGFLRLQTQDPRLECKRGVMKANRRTMSHVVDDLQFLGDGRYKGILLDQFGVLHDGQKPYEGAIDAVRYLSDDLGMKILIVSNSSRRSHGALSNLERMGFPMNAFHGVITSGEMTHIALQEKTSPFWKNVKRCLHITWASRAGSPISLDGLDVEIVEDPNLADTIIAHGTEAIGSNCIDGITSKPKPVTLDQLKDLLRIAAQRPDMPSLVVANPDIVTVQGTELRTMPGTLARWYHCMTTGIDGYSDPNSILKNEKIVIMGKPASCIYDEALKMLELGPDEVIAIGDSLEHDIAGASQAGIDSVFVAGGIHAKELGVEKAHCGFDNSLLEELCLQYNAFPQYITRYFTK